MKEFIVWHTLRKEFVQPYRNIVFDDSGIAESDLCTIHNYISLKDINNNKIYADCSIVEFTYKDFSTSENVVLQGYFTWDDEDLRYKIDILNHSLYVCLNYRINLVVNIKIIDTIQENKLGLIKE